MILLSLTVIFGGVFALWPDVDLAVGRIFHGEAGFAARHGWVGALRDVLYALPALVAVLLMLGWIAGRVGKLAPKLATYSVSGRALAFALLAMAMAPGLLVNGILKNHSHRPRPVHVEEFGGTAQFRPWWRFDGACKTNCSFASGEVSGAFWLIAPAYLAPPPVRSAAIAAAVFVGVLTALVRLAMGGHFLSDVVLAALFTILISQALYLVLIGRKPGKRELD